MEKAQGFTLIELLVVTLIIGILAGSAYPAYKSYTLSANRSDAQNELQKAQLVQSSWHILNPDYSNAIDDVGLPNNHNYYTFSIISAGRATYSMKAIAKLGTMQANDKAQCTTLVIDQDNAHYDASGTNNDQCW